VSVPEPGTRAAVTVTGPHGRVRLLVLSGEQALLAQRVSIGGTDRLVLCEEPVLSDGPELRLHTSRSEVTVRVLTADGFTRRTLTPGEGAPSARPLPVETVRSKALAPPARTGGPHGRASAPRDEDFEEASVHRIEIPAGALDGEGEVLLRLSYTGDAARAYVGGRLVADHFWYGPAWELGLRRFADAVTEHGIEIRVLPLAPDSAVYVDPSARAGLAAARTRATVESAELVPVHRLTLPAGLTAHGTAAG
jgi:hypothetical protein